MVDILSPLTVDGKVRSKDVSTLDSTDSDDTLAPKGYVDSVSETKLDTTGGLLTGPLTVEGGANINTSGHIEGTMLRTTADTHLAMVPPKYAVLDSSGWVYHRTLDETKSDLGITSKQDKLEAGMNITIDGNTISAKGTTYEVATETSDGLMSSGDKSLLIALDSAISTHVNSTSNPHNVTKSQIGLGDVDNTSDLYKPISIAVQEALNLKADKSEISRIYRPCGSVATINDLPSDAQIGDVYDVAETGMNYAWVEIGGVAKWDSLGMLSDKIDMTNYYTKGQVDEALAGKAGTSVATQSANGLMSTDDKKKLDGIESGAQKNTITGVKGSSESTYRTGNVSISPANIGLGNVNNTSDADKPISTATQSALNKKQNTMSAGTGITFDGVTINHSNSVAATTSYVGSATAVPRIQYDAQGHITACTTATIYPPTSAGTSGQIWQSDGNGTGVWQTLDTAPTANSTKAITSGGVKAELDKKAGTAVATTSANGLMSSTDKSKLDGITESADAVSFTRSLTSGTKVGTITINGTGTDIYCHTNTDTKVAQNNDTSTNANLPILVSATADSTTARTGTVKYVNGKAYINPSTGLLTATKFKGPLEGNVTGNCSGSSGSCTGNSATATKATKDANGNNIVDTYETKANAITGLSASGTTITYTKGDGSTGTITTQDKNTDTKNTAGSTDTSSKIFLIGATSQAANPQTYSHDTAYVGTDGKLYSGGKVVIASGDKATSAGSADSATKAGQLTTARTIAISGGATGTATSFDGSANITIPVTALDVSKANAGTLAVARGGTGATNLANVTVGKATALNVSSTSAIAITAGVQFISTTILSQTGNWFIETHVSGTNIFQRATSMADPSNVCVRTSSNSGSSWNGWVFSYAVWK